MCDESLKESCAVFASYSDESSGWKSSVAGERREGWEGRDRLLMLRAKGRKLPSGYGTTATYRVKRHSRRHFEKRFRNTLAMDTMNSGELKLLRSD